MADLRHIARRKARKYGLDPRIFARQIGAESGFNPTARSPAGALGVAQIMPATARGWRVDPLKPRQALDAAAKNMAAYVRRYGSYENALRAYNAGPGAIEASRGYAETNAYVQKILGGTDPGRLGKPRQARAAGNDRAGSQGTPSRVELGEQVTFDEAGYEKARRAALVGGLIAKRRGTDSILFRSGVLSTTMPSAGDFQSSKLTSELVRGTRPTPRQRPEVTKSSKGVSVKGPLLELFWQGPRGIDVKNGKVVPQGFVEGHTEHVHVAANPREVIRLGKIAQRMGLNVGENPRFGGVTQGAHVTNSLHYSRRAIDVSGPTNQLAVFAHRVARLYGAGG